jgi:uncharacterized protein (DUF2236 family)
MSCPVDPVPGLQLGTSIEAAERRVAGREAPRSSELVKQFDRISGSVFVALFGASLFDQTMLPSVSAALEATGRIRADPIMRGLRTAASEQLVFAGGDDDRRREAERLLRLHREVKGVASDGSRYSALDPELWNWILISTFVMHRGAFIAITDIQPTVVENQAIWDRFREITCDLHLPGRGSGLIADYEELCAYYDQMITEKLQRTATLNCAVTGILRPRRPAAVPLVAAPLWAVAGRVIGHVLAVLGFGIMHPGVRALVPMSRTRWHDIEFVMLTRLLRLAYRWLPRRLTDTPLARNRRQYKKIVTRYEAIGLTSFAPEGA